MQRPRHRPGRGPALSTAPRLQPLTRARVASLGAPGAAWADGLPDLLVGLAADWSLTLGRALPGGSASYVVEATTADGDPRVLKVVLPDPALADEARTLGAAGGRGYALLHAHDPGRRALLLEALGPSLEQVSGAPEESLAILADTLREAWRVPLAVAPPLAPGADRASELHRTVRRSWQELGEPCSRAVLDEALACAQRRAAEHDPAACVVVHGDPHLANLLRVREARPGAGSGYVFVDPDGVRADPACDAGVAIRDWTARLEQADDPRRVLEGYCALLAARTGLPEQRIWEWGFLERVSTGLYVLGFGAERLGRRFLDSAERLLSRPGAGG